MRIVVKDKICPRTVHEGPEVEWNYNSTLSSTSALDGGGWLTTRPGRFTPGKVTQYPFYRRLNGCGKPRLHRDSIPGHAAHNGTLYRLSYRGPLIVGRTKIVKDDRNVTLL